MKKLPFARFLVGLVAAGAIAGGAYAYTAANTVPTSTAGAGSGTVSGYTVSSLHYALNTSTPANIDSLTFTVSPVTADPPTDHTLRDGLLSRQDARGTRADRAAPSRGWIRAPACGVRARRIRRCRCARGAA